MKVLMYRSQGMDDMAVPCLTVEQAVNCFRTDAEAILAGEEYEIELWHEDMTEIQLHALCEGVEDGGEA